MVFGKGEVLGLDIGSSSIKLVEIKETKSGYRLKNIGEALLAPDAIVDKVIADYDAVADPLYELIDNLRIKTKNAVISVSGKSVIIKKITLPIMDEKELREAIPWEIKQFIPQSIDDINYDFQVLPEETPEGNMEVLVAAAKKDITNDYMEIVSEVGLNPIVLDIDLFALENMYEINYSETKGILALVDIGASITNINILSDGISIFTRDLTMGGRQFSDWIQKEFDVGYDEAEKMKYSLINDEIQQELKTISQDFIESMCGEINRTLDFFSSTFSTEKVDKIMLGGGSSKVPNLPQALEGMSESKVEIVNPFRNIIYSQKDFDPEYISDMAPKMGVAIGLAIRRAGDNL